MSLQIKPTHCTAVQWVKNFLRHKLYNIPVTLPHFDAKLCQAYTSKPTTTIWSKTADWTIYVWHQLFTWDQRVSEETICKPRLCLQACSACDWFKRNTMKAQTATKCQSRQKNNWKRLFRKSRPSNCHWTRQHRYLAFLWAQCMEVQAKLELVGQPPWSMKKRGRLCIFVR